jgi:FdrA protein
VIVSIKFYPDSYIDSVIQLGSMRAMGQVAGIDWTSAGMATPVNLETLGSEGVAAHELEGRGSNDFFIVVRARNQKAAAQALTVGEQAVFAARPQTGEATPAAPRSLREAVKRQPDTNVAVISLPGEYATLAAYQALSQGLNVLLFSDNVPLHNEIALKNYARSKGLLAMGPGAGTAALGGVCLGFANVVRPGRVGIVAAAGTGAQETMALLDRWGVGVSQVIGLGGRDLTAEVGGTMALSAIRALRDDPDTEVILLVSKPPDASVAARVLATAGNTPLVAALIGLDPGFVGPPGVILADTLESGVVATLAVLNVTAPETSATLGPTVAAARARLDPRRTLVRGLFSGGTLCYESLLILGRTIGEVRSNTPINKAWGLPAPSGTHQCLDLGEEEYTRGRPHPMIDAQARLEMLREHGADPQVAAIILDLVLGYGANPDPAGVLAPVCESVMADRGPQVVAYVLGTEHDPQGFAAQRAQLVQAGCIVTETAARASLVAAAIATGDASLVGQRL